MTAAADLGSAAAEASRALPEPRAPVEAALSAAASSMKTRSDERATGVLTFDAVYEAQFDFVWRSLRLLGIPGESLEDAVQDTFSVVARQLASFEGRSQLNTWLFQILRRVAANYRRTHRRKRSQLTPLEEAPSQEPTPHALVEAAEVARVVEHYCSRLSAEARELFVLAVLEEAPARDVSAALGLPIALVYSRVFTLREGLRRALAAQEEEHG